MQSALSRAHSTFLTGCYNATVSLFSTTGQRQATITGHSQPVLSTCWLGDSEDLIASGGMDRIIRVNRLSSPAALDATTIEEPQRTAALTYLLPLHSQPVSSVRSSSLPSTAPRLLSAGWDGLVALWSLSSAYEGATAGEEEVRAKKKRKTAARPDETGAKKLAAVHVLQGHTGQVARAVFDREEVRKAYSAGWDHSVRTWDLEAGSQLSTRVRSSLLAALVRPDVRGCTERGG